MLIPLAWANFKASVLRDSFSLGEEGPEIPRFQVVDLMTLSKLYGVAVMGDREFKTVHGNLLLGRTLCYTSWGPWAYEDALARMKYLRRIAEASPSRYTDLDVVLLCRPFLH